jgi:alanine racemase
MRELVVDLEAIRHNVRTIAARVAPARLMAVVKADAYGHGLVPVARAMAEAGVDAFGVVDLEEARRLRDAGVEQPILAWIHGADADLDWGVRFGIELGVGALATLERIADVMGRIQALTGSAGTEPTRAVLHLKTDSGLGRGGALGDEWAELVTRAAELERAGLVVVRGVWTHLANASPEADEAQFAAFDAAIDIARAAGLDPKLEHASASAAMLAHPGQARGMVRVGLALYGLSPFPEQTSAELGLRPAMEVAGEVVSVKRVPAGLGVSYGHRYVTPRETTLALVPLGYADGLPRAATGRAPVWLGGRRYEVAGTISMDQVVIDVGDDAIEVGDRAVFWGDPTAGVPSAQDWADAAGTIPYEIVTRVGHRVRRRYVG